MSEARLGTAEWLGSTEIADRFPFSEGAIWLGRLEDGTPVGRDDDRHVCLVAGSRSGKGTTLIANNLCLYPGSVVVVDPKGENASITAARRGEGSSYCDGLGQTVHVLDPFNAATVNASTRSRFNPLAEIDPRNPEAIDDAKRLAAALVIVTEKENKYFEEAAREVLCAIILHVLTAKHFEGRRNLVTVRRLLVAGEAERVRELREAGRDHGVSAQELFWSEVRDNRAFNGTLSGMGERFLTLSFSVPKEFESIRQSALQSTSFIDSPQMSECLSSSSFRLAELKTLAEGMSLYLSLPDRFKDTHCGWLRVVITMVVTEMERVRGRPKTGHPVLMLLDEFASLKRLDVMEMAVDKIAGYGVKLFFVLQDLGQLKKHYQDGWETFLANAGLKVFFTNDDNFTREYVSKLVGNTQVTLRANSTSNTRSETEGTSQSHTEGYSHNESSNRGRSGSHGRSTSEGTNHSASQSSPAHWRHDAWDRGSSSTSSGRSSGSSNSTTDGWSSSSSSGSSSSTSSTGGTSRSTTRGDSTGSSETIHVRPLVSPDEVGRYFTAIDDRNAPDYPGLALVLISGRPLVVQKVNYYEDYDFFRTFDPHPDHGGPAQRQEIIPLEPLRQYAGFLASTYGVSVAPEVSEGDMVHATTPLIGIHASNLGHAFVRAPRTGQVMELNRDALEALSYRHDTSSHHPLLTLASYAREPEGGDPFAEVYQLCRRAHDELEAVTVYWIRMLVGAAAVAAIGVFWAFADFSWWSALVMVLPTPVALAAFRRQQDARSARRLFPGFVRYQPLSAPPPAPPVSEREQPSAGTHKTVTCSTAGCGARNRVPVERLDGNPKCGACHQVLFVVLTCTAAGCGAANRVPSSKVNAGPKCGACRQLLDANNAPSV